MEARKQINEQSGTQQSGGNGKLRTHSKGEKKKDILYVSWLQNFKQFETQISAEGESMNKMEKQKFY